MSYQQNYRGVFKNREGQLVTINIADRSSVVNNPYNLSYSIVDNGDGTQTLTIPFSGLPSDTDNIRIAYSADGGATFSAFTDFPIPATSSPIAYTIPVGTYIYLLQVQFSDPFEDDENYVLNELEGIFDELVPNGDPLHLIINNNGEEKMATIGGLQAVMQFNAQDNAVLNKLLRGTYNDKRYYTTIDIEGNYIFKGFLNLFDTQEPFLPRPVIQLTANDGLGSLKNKTLKDFYAENPTGQNTIIEYFSWCLAQTGVLENFNVVMNIREEDDGTIAAAPDKHFFLTQSIHAKTFETEVNESEDCYTVLNKLCKRLGRLGQRHGEWWFKNFDEYDAQPDYVAVFNSDGEFVEALAGAYYNKNIGINESMKWSNHSATVGFTSPGKMAKLLFRYELPREIPCNKDFERGDELPGGTPTEKKFDIDCWDKLFSNTLTDDPATQPIYIKRLYTNGYENERYMVIEGSSDFNFIMSEGIPVGVKDKFTIDISRRMSGGTAGSGFYRDNHVQVRLYGDDGSFWTCQGKNSATSASQWVACTSIFRTNQKFFSIEGDISESQVESKNLYDGDSAEIPVNGVIKILIYQSSQFGATSDTIIDRLDFELFNYINGTHKKFTGDFHKVSQDADNNESIDDEVFISNAPAKIIKGALHKISGYHQLFAGLVYFASGNSFTIPGNHLSTFNTPEKIIISGTTSNNMTAKVLNVTYSILASSTVVTINKTTVTETAAAAVIDTPVYVLSERFWNAAVYPGGVPSDDYYHPFGYIQTFNSWNQIRLLNRGFRGSIQGIESDVVDARGKCDVASIFHSYYMTDIDEHSSDKKFMLLNCDIDIFHCAMVSSAFKEVHDELVGKKYDDSYEFKYITR